MKMNTETLRLILNEEVESCKREIEKFKTSLDKDPAYAFSWGGAAVSRAAESHVVNGILHLVDILEKKEMPAELIIAEIVMELQRDVLRRAEEHPSSTSHMSNIVENEMRCYTAKWLRKLSR